MRKIVSLSLALAFVLVSQAVMADGSAVERNTDKNPIPTVTIPHPSTSKPDNTPKGLVILNDFYAVDEKKAYVVNELRTGWEEIEGADRKAFTVIRGQFARDKDHAYKRGQVVEGADIQSFSVISATNGYSMDDDHVYGPNGVIEDADPDTFKMVTKNYAMDAGNVYFDGEKMVADSGTFAVIDNGLYATDAGNVFYAGEQLRGISPEGFVVKGPRAWASNGDVFFEGQVEKGNVPTDEDDSNGDDPTIIKDITETIKPYVQYITDRVPFWIILFLAGVGLWSMIFVFFSERNDAPVSGTKVFFKSLISLIIAGLITWGVSRWVSPGWALFLGLGIGAIFFISLMAALGILRAILITILSLIVFICLGAIFGLLMRAFVVNIHEFFGMLVTHNSMEIILIAIIGLFIGMLLIFLHLQERPLRAFGQSLGATLVSITLLAFLQWIGDIGTILSVIIFSALYGILLWIMRFRMVSDLFVETVRIVRVVLILGVVIGLVLWIVL